MLDRQSRPDRPAVLPRGRSAQGGLEHDPTIPGEPEKPRRQANPKGSSPSAENLLTMSPASGARPLKLG